MITINSAVRYIIIISWLEDISFYGYHRNGVYVIVIVRLVCDIMERQSGLNSRWPLMTKSTVVVRFRCQQVAIDDESDCRSSMSTVEIQC